MLCSGMPLAGHATVADELAYIYVSSQLGSERSGPVARTRFSFVSSWYIWTCTVSWPGEQYLMTCDITLR